MDKNLKNQTGYKDAASGSAPGGMKKLDPTPSGSKVKNISGPSIHATNKGGDKVNNTGVDSKATVISS
jgi:hypothetical protein